MKRQMYVAILLVVLFTTATIMAGVDPEPPDAVSTISASAQNGPIFVRTYTGRIKIDDYSDVIKIKDSSGCVVKTIPAKYDITHSVNAKGKISGARWWVIVKVTTTASASGGTLTSPYDEKTETIEPIFWLPRKINVSEDHTSKWQTSSQGCYTFTSTGTGQAKYSAGKLEIGGDWGSIGGENGLGVLTASWTNGTDETTVDVSEITIIHRY